MGIQVIEPALPLTPKRLNPIGSIFQSAYRKLAWSPLGIPAARNQACALKNSKVFGDGRLAQMKRLHEF